MHFTAIPMVDMDLLQRNPEMFGKELRDICHQVGFFYLKNHGISSSLLNNVLSCAREFFALPQHDKDSVDIKNSPHYRGYGKLNAESTKGVADYKETYDLGLESYARNLTDQEVFNVLHGPNQWPSAHLLPNFKSTILKYISAMQDVGCSLMEVIADSLGFPPKIVPARFNPHSDNAYAILRLLHYPPSQEKLGVGPHVDAGFLVFLLQDEVGGLQVQNHQGDWIDAAPIPDTFVVNIGEMLQVWSGGYLQATPHRVLNTSTKYRVSAPFFFEPHLNSVIFPQNNPEQLPKVVYGEHMLDIFKRSFKN